MQEGFVEHIATIAEEFVTARDLRPLRIVVHGPPAVGKSALAQLLGAEYHIPVVSAREALARVLARPVKFTREDTTQPSNDDVLGTETAATASSTLNNEEDANTKEADADEERNEDADEQDVGAHRSESEFAQALRDAVAQTLQQKGRLPDALMGLVVRWVLLEPRMRNRGYVLDGLPRSYTEATYMFGAEYGEGKRERYEGR